MKAVVFFLTISVFMNFNAFCEENYLISGVPYKDYITDSDVDAENSGLIVLGWSRDGKIMYRIMSQNNIKHFICNLIDDKIIWSSDDNEIQQINEAAERYAIESFVERIGEFPYIDNEENGYEIARPAMLRYEYAVHGQYPDRTDVRIYMHQNFGEGKVKIINTMVVPHEESVIRDIKPYWYAKSPFENRIAVIAVISKQNRATDAVDYEYQLFGCHLDVGFVDMPDY
ncbi:MAG: hypothetical protein LBK08_09700 [Treponema sp.]|jgi:hypothetical protein|nr:hypothetical protein [Treponema sp.]